MSKLPNIFHNNSNFNSNNKHSYNTFNNKKEIINNSINVDNLINYFNKRITITLNNKEEYTGTLISKRNNYIMLDTKEKINIKDIISIK